MSSQNALLPLIRQVSATGSGISQNMLSFLESVPTQPLGFRDLGLNFLEISRIINALESSLEEHFRTNQPFPERAVPELERVLGRTEKDFGQLEVLLGKFMKYEAGGITGRVMKTWRMLFADKDVMKISKSMIESKGALNMAVLLVNVNPAGVIMAGQYQVLEQRLHTQAQALGSSGPNPVSSTPPIAAPIPPPTGHAVEIDGTAVGPERAELDGSKEAEAPPRYFQNLIKETEPEHEVEPAPSIVIAESEPLSVKEPKKEEPPVASMSNLQIDKKEAPLTHKQEVPPPSAAKEIIKVDRSNLVFKTPTSTVGRNNAALCKALISAIRGQKPNIIEQLLNRDVNPNGVADSEEHPVIIACMLDKIEPLKLLLEYGGDPDADSKRSKAGALRFVCERRHIAHLELLLQFGADPNRSLPEYAVLPHAIWENKFDYVELCLKYGADPSHISANKVIPLNYITHHRHDPKMMKLLIDWGADVNKPDGNNEPPVLYACKCVRPEHLEILLDNGGDPNLWIEGKDMALFVAVRIGSLECVKLLLKHGTDPNKVNGVLDQAIWKQNVEILKLLLETGPDLNEKKDGQALPIVAALRANVSAEVLELLLAAGADPTLHPGLLEYAVSRNNLDTVKLLIEAGVSVEDGSQGKSPLTTSIRDDRQEIFEFLLTCKADPNRMPENRTDLHPLLWAINYHEKYVKPLLDAGANPDLTPEILDKAAWKNRLDAIKILLDHGVDIEKFGPNKTTALHSAIHWDRPEIALYLLSRGADPNHCPKENVLLCATLKHRNTLIEPLLKAGADISGVNGIIELATWQNNLEGIKILVDNGASIEEVPHSGLTPLQTSIRDARKDIFNYLLSKGADPNHVGTDHPLYMCLELGREVFIEPLFKAGADRKLVTGIVEVATWRNNLAAIKIFVAHGCGVNEIPKSGLVALQTASRDGHEDILDWILSNDGDPNIAGTAPPLQQAVDSGRPTFIKKLLAAGADPKLCMAGLLAHAVWRNNLEVIKTLVETGKLDMNERHRDGNSPITVAIRDNRLETIKYLLSKGADPNAPGDGLPVVNAAQKEGHQEMLEMLLKAGADPNSVETDHKRTALVEAAYYGRVHSVKLLLENGAKPDLPNGRGLTALNAAAEKGHDEIVMLLLEKME